MGFRSDPSRRDFVKYAGWASASAASALCPVFGSTSEPSPKFGRKAASRRCSFCPHWSASGPDADVMAQESLAAGSSQCESVAIWSPAERPRATIRFSQLPPKGPAPRIWSAATCLRSRNTVTSATVFGHRLSRSKWKCTAEQRHRRSRLAILAEVSGVRLPRAHLIQIRGAPRVAWMQSISTARPALQLHTRT
jgi:hypothetical protein